MELLKDTDPIDGIMRIYDETENKREFVIAISTTLLLRHRQWQIASLSTNIHPVCD